MHLVSDNGPVHLNRTPSPEWLADNSQREVTGHVVLVTPTLARQWLEANHPKNRKIRNRNITNYSRDIVEGRWKVTHQGICFSADGWLLDGQHRLKAIVDANTPAHLLVFVDWQDETFGVLDTGATRNLIDFLAVSREPYGTIISYISRLYNRQLHGRQPGDAERGQQMLDLLQNEIDELVHILGNLKRREAISSVPVRAMLLLRYHFADAAEKTFLRGQWLAMHTLTNEGADMTTQTLIRALTKTIRRGGSRVEEFRAALAWAGFDPKRRGMVFQGEYKTPRDGSEKQTRWDAVKPEIYRAVSKLLA